MGEVAKRRTWLIASLCLLRAGVSAAQETRDPNEALSQEDRIAELERTVAALSEELARARVEVAVPEDSLTSAWGFGPAASKVYGRDRGLSIGGYGEGFYTNYVADQGHGTPTTGKTLDRADMLRAVLYTGYRFNENIVFNAEIEFEHATTEATKSSSGGSVSVEFAALDFFWRPALNFRTGLVLLPVGFLNLMHEPPFYYGVNRPDVERMLIPSTWRENGAGIFGRLGETVQYTAYAVNGMNARGFNSTGIRGGRQNGNRALAEDLAFVGRVDWTPMPELLLGASVYAGDSGQDQRVSIPGGTTELPSTPTVLWEAHGQYESHGLHLRGLFTMTHIGDAGSLTQDLLAASEPGFSGAVASGLLGGYGEVAYDVLPLLFPGSERFLAPFYRFEWYDTQWNMPSGFGANESREIMVHTLGLQFEPIPNVVLKLDYRNRSAKEGQIPDEVNLGFGYAF